MEFVAKKLNIRTPVINQLLFSTLRSKLTFENKEHVLATYKKYGKRTIVQDCDEILSAYLSRNLDSFSELLYADPIFVGNTQTTNIPKGYILWTANTVYIQFRGTHHLDDVLRDIDIRQKSFPKHQEIKIHQGYYDTFFSFEEELTKIIVDICASLDIKRIYFCGFSLGGGLATISAPHYATILKNKQKILCHTFASPMVGNAIFKQWFESKVDTSIRIECEGDFIPNIPLSKGFVHVSDGYTLMKNGTIEKWSAQKYFTYVEFMRDIVLLKPTWEDVIRDHSINNYMISLFRVHSLTCS